MASTGTWLSGDSLSPSLLNLRGSSALTTTGFSTNTLQAEAGSTISALGQTVTMSTLSATDIDSADVNASKVSCSNVSLVDGRLQLYRGGDTPIIDMFHAQGSWQTPTAPSADAQQLGIYSAGGYNGANWFVTGRLEWESTESWVAGAKTGTRLNVMINPTGSASQSDIATFDGSGISSFATVKATDFVATSGIELLSGHLKVPATNRIYLDGGDNTYLIEAEADKLYGVVGGATQFTVSTTLADFQDNTVSAASLNVDTDSGALAGDAAGTTGDIAWGADSGTTYVYVCTSTNSWMRAALSPF